MLRMNISGPDFTLLVTFVPYPNWNLHAQLHCMFEVSEVSSCDSVSAGYRLLFSSSTSHWMIQLPLSWWRGPSSELRPQFKSCGTCYAMLWSTAFEWSSVLSSVVYRSLAHVLWDSCVLGCKMCSDRMMWVCTEIKWVSCEGSSCSPKAHRHLEGE